MVVVIAILVLAMKLVATAVSYMMVIVITIILIAMKLVGMTPSKSCDGSSNSYTSNISEALRNDC